jgi:isochorismate hydrolase
MPEASDLPANTAQWTVDPDRAVLLIHDMQKYFLKAFPAGEAPVVDLVRNIALLRERCTTLGIPVAYTTQPGSMTEDQRGLLKDFWGPGMSVSPEEREVVEELSPRDGDWVFLKWRYSAFHRSPILHRTREQNRDQLIVCGIYAHIGVLMTACDAFSFDIQPFMVADAVADFSWPYHRMATQYAAERCAVVTTAKQLLSELPSTKAPSTGREALT